MSVDHTELLGVSRRLIKRHVGHLVTGPGNERAEYIDEEAAALAQVLADAAETRLADLAEDQRTQADVSYQLREAA